MATQESVLAQIDELGTVALRHKAQRDRLLEALEDALEFIEPYEDATTESLPNRAMQLGEEWRRLVASVKGSA